MPTPRRQGRSEPVAELGPLPAGRHGLSREQVAESQRERLLAGIVSAVADAGYKGTTIADIVKVASVSSRAFYESFASKEECFLAAFDAVVAHLEELLAEAIGRSPDWPRGVIAALDSALEFFDGRPELARFCLVEPITATPAIAARFHQVVLGCAPYLAAGRLERADSDSLPESTEDSLLGALVLLGHRSILDEAASLHQLLPDFAEFALSPYLGRDAAKALALEAPRPAV